jgi:hypothetical protein
MKKTSDYGGGGLNRGRSMHYKKQLPTGVVFSKHINMWLVRILKNGTPTTLGKFKTQEDAEVFFQSAVANER